MKLTLIAAISLAFTLSACMDSPVTEGRADLPPKDFSEYAKERKTLQNSSNDAGSDVVPYK